MGEFKESGQKRSNSLTHLIIKNTNHEHGVGMITYGLALIGYVLAKTWFYVGRAITSSLPSMTGWWRDGKKAGRRLADRGR